MGFPTLVRSHIYIESGSSMQEVSDQPAALNTTRTISCKVRNSPAEYPSREYKHDITSHWRHNDHDGVSNHQPYSCLLNHLFRGRSKKTSKLRVTGLCAGNSPGPVNSSHNWPVTRKTFPFDDVIMKQCERNMFNPIPKENVQGQKHPRRCAVVELPSHRTPKWVVQNE